MSFNKLTRFKEVFDDNHNNKKKTITLLILYNISMSIPVNGVCRCLSAE